MVDRAPRWVAHLYERNHRQFTIMIALLVIISLLLAFGARMLWVARRQTTTPAELRGDWWPQFEQEFRAYAKRSENRPHRARPNHDKGSQPR